MSLTGVGVALTHARSRVESLTFLLEDEGAELSFWPVLDVEPAEDPRPFLAVMEQIHRYPWLALSSPAAVEAVLEGARLAGTRNRLSEVGFIAGTPATARLLKAHGLNSRLELPEAPQSRAVLLAQSIASMDELILPCGDVDNTLAQELADAGAMVLSVLAWQPVPCPPAPEVAPWCWVLSTPGVAQALLGNPQSRTWFESGRRVAANAAVQRELEALGVPAHAMPARSDPESLVDAVLSLR